MGSLLRGSQRVQGTIWMDQRDHMDGPTDHWDGPTGDPPSQDMS